MEEQLNWSLLGEDVLKIIMKYKNLDDIEKMYKFILKYDGDTKKNFKEIIKYYNKLKGYKVNSKGYVKITGNWYELKNRYVEILELLNINYAFTFTGLIYID